MRIVAHHKFTDRWWPQRLAIAPVHSQRQQSRKQSVAILTVGPNSTFPTIAAAMAAAGTGDIITLEAGYGNENATVTVNGLSFDGLPSSTNINLQLTTGISTVTLLGTAPINIGV